MGKVGAVYSVIQAGSGTLIVQDASGGRFLISVAATNYVPPSPAPSASATNAATATNAPPATSEPAASSTNAALAPSGDRIVNAAAPQNNLSADDAARMKQINDALGIPLLVDGNPWQDDVGQMAYRLRWPRESLTSTQESYRRYATKGQALICGTSAYSLALYGKAGRPTYVSIVLANAGDFDGPGKKERKFENDDSPVMDNLARAVKHDEETITTALTQVLGDPASDFYGSTSEDRDEVRRWDWHDVSFLLSAHGGEYATLKVVPTEVADKHGTVDVIDRDQMRDLLAQRVMKRDNGDVIISDIPMVDQGPKGYCAPATWERYLRYMDVPADLYVLAAMGGAGLGGGTTTSGMQGGVENYVSAYHRRIETDDDPLELPDVAKYIDQGLPLMWGCTSTQPIEIQTYKNTLARQKVSDWAAYRKMLDAQDNAMAAPEIAADNGHMRMIIGYNNQTQEIAISDSWGEAMAERWMSIETAKKIHRGYLAYLSW
jgi:hypothetical protein